jgi:uncharacterized protein (TIGR03437 family)
LPGTLIYSPTITDYSSYFETIEGGMGFWGSTKFGTATPKYRVNGTPNCYTAQVSSPGFTFGGTALPDNSMGLAQLSNRLIMPPDGLTFQSGVSGQLMGVAWMAMPFLEYKGYYYLQSQIQSANAICLDGNSGGSSPLGGGAYMGACGSSNGQYWTFVSAGNGYYRLQNLLSQSSNQCLEGNTGNSADPHGGTPYMTTCGTSAGQLWTFTETATNRYWLQTQLSQASNLCLESGDGTSASRMSTCGNFTGRNWDRVAQTPTGVLPVGDHSWTLFLNTANFKGPVAFYIPDIWESLNTANPLDAGRGMDIRGGITNSAAMEFNTVPYFLGSDANGVVYSKIPRIQFPVDSNGQTVLMQDGTYYSAQALFNPAAAWFAGGVAYSGEFNASGASPLAGCSVNPVTFQQHVSASDTSNVPLTGLAQTVQTVMLDKTTCKWGLQWTGAQQTTSGGLAVFPEYFQQSGTSRAAVAASSVPASTQLAGATFAAATSGAPYVAPATAAWTTPGPASGPYSVNLADGSTATYYWYRFVDQPALQHLGMTAAAKNQLQQLVTQIHMNWPVNMDYMAPPSSGTLLNLDNAMIVTPPAGLEAGYVPIVTRQGTPIITGVVNAAGGNAVIAPNTYVTITGTDLAPANDSRIWQGSDFANNQLPNQLDGTSVTVNGVPAYVYFISAKQINILTPPNAISQTVPVQVTVNGVASNTIRVAAQASAPAFFQFGSGPYVAATHANGNLLGPASLYPGATTPAKPGEQVILYGNGFGSTTPEVVGGSVMQSGTLAPLPVFQIGGITATVQFAGLISPGLFQFNVVIPTNAANGDLAIRATYNGASTQTGASIAVQQ